MGDSSEEAWEAREYISDTYQAADNTSRICEAGNNIMRCDTASESSSSRSEAESSTNTIYDTTADNPRPSKATNNVGAGCIKRAPHCAFCQNHGLNSRTSSHQCPYNQCQCLLCQLTRVRRVIMRHQQRLWRHFKVEAEGGTQGKEKGRKLKPQQCDLCRNHGQLREKRAHKDSCPHQACSCTLCTLTRKRRTVMKLQQRVQRSYMVTNKQRDEAYDYLRKTSKELEQLSLDISLMPPSSAGARPSSHQGTTISLTASPKNGTQFSSNATCNDYTPISTDVNPKDKSRLTAMPKYDTAFSSSGTILPHGDTCFSSNHTSIDLFPFSTPSHKVKPHGNSSMLQDPRALTHDVTPLTNGRSPRPIDAMPLRNKTKAHDAMEIIYNRVSLPQDAVQSSQYTLPSEGITYSSSYQPTLLSYHYSSLRPSECVISSIPSNTEGLMIPRPSRQLSGPKERYLCAMRYGNRRNLIKESKRKQSEVDSTLQMPRDLQRQLEFDSTAQVRLESQRQLEIDLMPHELGGSRRSSGVDSTIQMPRESQRRLTTDYKSQVSRYSTRQLEADPTPQIQRNSTGPNSKVHSFFHLQRQHELPTQQPVQKSSTLFQPQMLHGIQPLHPRPVLALSHTYHNEKHKLNYNLTTLNKSLQLSPPHMPFPLVHYYQTPSIPFAAQPSCSSNRPSCSPSTPPELLYSPTHLQPRCSAQVPLHN